MRHQMFFFKPITNEHGVSIILVAILLVLFLGITALAIDFGHNYVVRNELKNAADAAALVGANKFYPRTPSTPTPPNWGAAETEAANAIQLNKSDNASLQVAEVVSGYWNLRPATPPALPPAPAPDLLPQGTTIPSTECTSTYPCRAPAVKVTVRRAAGINSGPVQNFFAGLTGQASTDQGVVAIAVVTSPGSVKPGALLPIAVTRHMAETAGYGSTNTFRIGSSYHYPDSQAGQWTSLNLDTNNVPDVRDLIAYGNPTPLSVGDNIWIQPGTKTTLYGDIPVGTTVLVPVVDAILSDSTHSAVPIWGFIGFHITASEGGSGKYIEGYFLANYYAGLGGSSGPNRGVFIPSKLVW